MRWLVGLLLLGGVAAAAPIGFDHSIHEGKVVAAAAEPPACASCHRADRKPGHAGCFTAGCHSMPKKGGAPLCRTCHAEEHPRGVPARQRKAFYPPYSVDRDFSTPFAHDAHAGRAGCETCHGVPDDASRPRPAAHAACATCHATAAAPAMDACASCHIAVAGRDVTPRSERGPYAVRFAHRTHQGTPCASCHANVATTAGERVPTPPMTACETCHDGKTAFNALAPTCRRCHERDDRTLPSDAPVVLFSHERHHDRGLRVPCATCHAGADGGASRDHLPCASADCHASDFRAARPVTCGACHVGSEPWRPLGADRARRVRSEFGVEFSHGSHASDGKCATCHTGIAGGPEMRLGGGHATCATAGCHQQAELDRCERCHVPGLLDARDERRRTAKWSVAATFRHAGAGHGATECGACHATAAAAKTVAEIAPPAKATCAPCHDGARSFKMTGHGCARCHAKTR